VKLEIMTFPALTDYAREVVRVTKGCPECSGQDTVCVKHQPPLEAFLRTYLDARAEMLRRVATRCTTTNRRTVLTALVADAT
jgi:hypothetical protein